MPKLAQRMSRARPSAIMLIAKKAQLLKSEGQDIINFSIGVPNFLPGAHIYAAAHEALLHDSGQYGSNRGSDRLLDAFLEHLASIGLIGYERTHCVAAIGAKHIIYNLAEALLDEGDGFAFATPYWTSYMDIGEIVNADIQLLPCPPEQHYKLIPDELDAAMQKRPRVFLFNNPSNPTGMVYTKEEISALADVLVKYPETWIITDDIYNRMVFDGAGYYNFVQVRPELRDRLIFVDSLSKTYGMPGWRLGFMAGPEIVANAVLTLNSNHITSIPEVISAAGIAALSGPQDVPVAKCAEFQGRRDKVISALQAIPGIVCPKPKGAFYAFPEVSTAFGKIHQPSGRLINNDVDLCNMLLDTKGVACVPGSAFGEPRSLRISYTCPAEQLDVGLQRIQSFFSELVSFT